MACNKKLLFSILTPTLLIIGIGCIILGFLGPSAVDRALDKGIKQLLVIDSPNAKGFAGWQNDSQPNSVPQYQNFYFFNITNPDEVIQGKAKPKLVQLGPYSYIKHTTKFKISWDEDGDIVNHKSYTFFVYQPDKTVGNPYTDMITTINIPFQAVKANLGTDWWQELTFDLFASSTNSSLFVTKTPHELAFGYEDPLLKFISNLQPGTSTNFQLQINQTSIENADNTTKEDSFRTGKSDLKKIMQYVKFQGNHTLNIWGSDEANTVQGTDATQFSPGISQNDQPIAFVDTAFRSINLQCTKSVKIQGIDMLRFQLAANNFLNASQYPANGAYYQFGPSGVGNLTKPSQGAPIFMSQPHFLNCDPSYGDAVDGLSPDPTIHDTWIDVEPISGTTMNVAKRLQVNVLVDELLLLYPNINKTYFPVCWIELESTIPSNLAKQFRHTVYGAETAKQVLKLGGWIGGGFVIAIGIVMSAILIRIYRNDLHENRVYDPIGINDE